MACTTKLSITGSSSRICEREPAASSHLNKGAEVRLIAVAVVLRTGSNRTAPDRFLGLIGGGSGESALVAALSTLIVFPYRTASIQEWVWFTLRLADLFALFGMGLVSDECAQHALSVNTIRNPHLPESVSGFRTPRLPLLPLWEKGVGEIFQRQVFLEAPAFLLSFWASGRPDSPFSPCGRRELGGSSRGRFFGKPRRSCSRSGLQDAQTPRVGEGSWEDLPGVGFLGSPGVPALVLGCRTPRLPLLPLWEKGVGEIFQRQVFLEAPAFLLSFWASGRPDSPFSPCGRRGQGG